MDRDSIKMCQKERTLLRTTRSRILFGPTMFNATEHQGPRCCENRRLDGECADSSEECEIESIST